jgi:probable rRNA maturation factor
MPPRARAAERRADARPRLSLSIQLGDGVDALPAPRAQLRRWVAAALSRDAELSLRFVGAREGRALNRDFRGRDYATNVLTFAYDEPDATPGAADRDGVARADLVVCLPVLAREARAQRKRLVDHLAHLVVHGTLHAQGWDHERDAREADAMEARERALLARFRIADPYAGPPRAPAASPGRARAQAAAGRKRVS